MKNYDYSNNENDFFNLYFNSKEFEYSTDKISLWFGEKSINE